MGYLTEGQRYEISALLQAGKTKKEICAIIGKDKSVLTESSEGIATSGVVIIWLIWHTARNENTGIRRLTPTCN